MKCIGSTIIFGRAQPTFSQSFAGDHVCAALLGRILPYRSLSVHHEVEAFPCLAALYVYPCMTMATMADAIFIPLTRNGAANQQYAICFADGYAPACSCRPLRDVWRISSACYRHARCPSVWRSFCYYLTSNNKTRRGNQRACSKQGVEPGHQPPPTVQDPP